MTQLNPELSLLDFEKPLEPLYKKAASLLKNSKSNGNKQLEELSRKILTLTKKIYKNLSHWDRTQVARHPRRPYAQDYIDHIFTDFTVLHGDRNYMDDHSTACGIAKLQNQPVVIIAQQKGRTMEENIKRNFGMPRPEGYRKALRFFEFAEKFNRPVITFIDTPGAYPGIESEERGQGEAIARNLKVMAGLKVPIISIVIGEGGSGGALGIGVANHVMMLENSIYSVISPESCASILWHNPAEKANAATQLKNDAKTALKLKIIDEIIGESVGGAHRDIRETTNNVGKAIKKKLDLLLKKSPENLQKERLHKFSLMGQVKMV